VKTDEAREIADTITQGLRFSGSKGDWRDLSPQEADSDYSWSDDLLGRIVVLVGEESIVHVSGFAERDSNIYGEIVVFTVTRLIRASFTAARTQGRSRLGLEAKVAAIGRAGIVGVRVEQVSPLGAAGTEAEWPVWSVAQVRLDDGTEFSMPLRKNPEMTDESGSAEFVSTLLR